MLVALLFGRPITAAAIPVFAHRYGFSCQQCHTTIPRLNPFGEYFRSHGFRMPGPQRVVPVAIKTNLTWSSDADPSGLPKAVVDEIELLTGGSAGRKTGYFVEQYVVDGGRPGQTRDAWLDFDLSREGANATTRVRVGQFTLALPVDPESERDTLTHYGLYDQTVGNNTFRFFDPRLGADVSIANARSGIEAHLDALAARDRPGGGGPGTDFFATVQKKSGLISVQAYRYEGKRMVAGTSDSFWRQGFALGYARKKTALIGVVQGGGDIAGSSHVPSGGGFVEATYDSSDALRFVGRYERTNDALAGELHQAIFAVTIRLKRNLRLTAEDLISQGHQSITTGLLFAY